MAGTYISPASANKLVRLGRRFLATIPAPNLGRWRKLTDGQLWVDVLGQLAVAGGAGGGKRLKQRLSGREDEWYTKLSAAPSARASRIHHELVAAGVRFVAANRAASAKTKAALANFNTLQIAGGPRAFFFQLTHKSEPERISYMRTNLRYVKHKGARDLLIGLGAVQDAIALDVRWKNILERVGVTVPENFQRSRSVYERLEQEILENVCKPLGVTGAHLDRVFFDDKNYKEIIRC
jgi:hypothetical protein